jgi:hypothetical protein
MLAEGTTQRNAARKGPTHAQLRNAQTGVAVDDRIRRI